MKILVVSDSHGNIKRLLHVLGFAKRAKIGAIIHCGDWDNPQACETVKNLGIPVYSVLGNADVAKSGGITKTLKDAQVRLEPEILNLQLGGKKIIVGHFPGKLADFIRSGKYDAVLYGHTHRRKRELHGKTLVVNPGALQSPFPSFAVYDTKTNNVEFIDIAI